MFDYNSSTYAVERGWLCPICHHVNAPWVRQCSCNSSWKISCDDTAPNHENGYYNPGTHTWEENMKQIKERENDLRNTR